LTDPVLYVTVQSNKLHIGLNINLAIHLISFIRHVICIQYHLILSLSQIPLVNLLIKPIC